MEIICKYYIIWLYLSLILKMFVFEFWLTHEKVFVIISFGSVCKLVIFFQQGKNGLFVNQFIYFVLNLYLNLYYYETMNLFVFIIFSKGIFICSKIHNLDFVFNSFFNSNKWGWNQWNHLRRKRLNCNALNALCVCLTHM